MLLDFRVGVNLLNSEVDSVSVRLAELIVGFLSFGSCQQSWDKQGNEQYELHLLL